MRKFTEHKVQTLTLVVAWFTILLLYLNRFLIPDTSFDTLNYHLMSGIRGLQNAGWPFGLGEFFPLAVTHFSPLYDMVNTLGRLALGYRLGTVLSLVSYFFFCWLLLRLSLLITPKLWRRHGFISGIIFIAVVLDSEMMMQVGTYYVDVMSATILLAAVYSFFLFLSKRNYLNLVLASLLLGIGFLGKMTALPLLVVLTPMIFYQIAKTSVSTKKKLALAILCGSLIATPFLVFSFRTYSLTSSPVFPFYNKVFKSPDYPLSNFVESRFGGQTLVQKLFWPVASVSSPSRLGEPENLFYDYKLFVFWLVLLLLIYLALFKQAQLSKAQLTLVIIATAYIFVWSLLSGYLRYVEPGLALSGLACMVWFEVSSNSRFTHFITNSLLLFLLISTAASLKFNAIYDLSWRPSFVANFETFRHQFHNLGNNELQLTAAQSRRVGKTQINLNCALPSAGYFAITPVIYAHPLVNIWYSPMLEDNAYKSNVELALAKTFGTTKSLSFTAIAGSIGLPANTNQCINNIERLGGSIDESFTINNYLGYKNEEVEFIVGHIGF